MAPQRLSPGTRLQNRYLVRQPLREGGFGIIYLCQDGQLQRLCAIKQNLDPSSDGAAQFLQEARILSGLAHPNLPRVSDLFDHPAGQFFVMDYISGANLQEMLDAAGTPFTVDRVLEWLPQMVSAVQHLHEQSPHPVLHRDIKPANFILTSEDVLYLVDFGIARVGQPGVPTQLGAQGISEGFSPPEQYTRAGTSPRSDQYALAATLTTLLTGVLLPESPLRFATPDPLQPASHYQPMLPPAVDAVLARALSVDPAGRYPSVTDFGQALAQALQSQRAFRLDPKDPASEIHSLQDLFDLCDSSRSGWEAALKSLASGRMAACLQFLGLDAKQLPPAPFANADRSLELLLRRLGRHPAQAPPGFDHQGVFTRLRNGEDVDVELHNPNPCGLVSGALHPVVEWIEISNPRFSLLPGERARIAVRVMPQVFASALARRFPQEAPPDPFVIVRD